MLDPAWASSGLLHKWLGLNNFNQFYLSSLTVFPHNFHQGPVRFLLFHSGCFKVSPQPWHQIAQGSCGMLPQALEGWRKMGMCGIVTVTALPGHGLLLWQCQADTGPECPILSPLQTPVLGWV